MDLESRARWADYSRAKDTMFQYTDTKCVAVVGRRRERQAARPPELHPSPAELVPYQDVTSKPLKLPRRQPDDYVRPPLEEQTFVPTVY